MKIMIEMIIILVFFTELKHDAFKYKFHVLEKQYKTSIRVKFIQQNFSYFFIVIHKLKRKQVTFNKNISNKMNFSVR